MAVLATAISAIASAEEALEKFLGKKFKRFKTGKNRGLVSHGDVGEAAAQLVFEIAQQMGLIKDSLSIQNASGHGIDLMVKDNNGKWISFEVKTSVRKSQGRLDGRAKKPNQRDGADEFTKSRLERAREGKGDWAGNPDREAKARQILKEIGRTKIEGYVIHITQYHKKGQQVEFRRWIKGSPRGTAIPNASSK